MLFSYFIRAIRRRYILVEPNLRFFHLFSASMIGNMGNNIFPMRVGEIMRCFVKKSYYIEIYLWDKFVIRKFIRLSVLIIKVLKNQ